MYVHQEFIIHQFFINYSSSIHQLFIKYSSSIYQLFINIRHYSSLYTHHYSILFLSLFNDSPLNSSYFFIIPTRSRHVARCTSAPVVPPTSSKDFSAWSNSWSTYGQGKTTPAVTPLGRWSFLMDDSNINI